MKNALFIQARSGSKRLPLKIFRSIGIHNSMLAAILAQVKESKEINEFYLSTSDSADESQLINLARELEMKVSTGPVDDIISRIHNVVSDSGCDHVVRVWGDCPFVCPDIIDELLETMMKNKWRFCSSADFSGRTTPPGLDVEIYSSTLIQEMHQKVVDPKLREFPVEFVKKNVSPNHYGFWNFPSSKSQYYLAIDYSEDLIAGDVLLKNLISKTGNQSFKSSDLFNLMNEKPHLFEAFSTAERNIEYKKYLSGNQGN